MHYSQFTEGLVGGSTRYISLVFLCLFVPEVAGASGNQAPKVISLAAENDHTCAVLESGEVVCWGMDEEASLGLPSRPVSGTPFGIAAVPNVPRAKSVAVGDGTTCVVTREGKVACWGKPWVAAKQMDPSDGGPAGPTVLPKLGGVVQVSLAKEYGCALRGSGDVWCWGNPELTPFWLGAKARAGATSGPEKVRGLGPATALTSTNLETCAVLRDGGVSCWGANPRAEYGDVPPVFGPNRIRELRGVKSFALDGVNTGCAVLRSGSVQCVSSDLIQRVLGAGTCQTCEARQLTSKEKMSALALSGYGGCVLDAEGSVACWRTQASGSPPQKAAQIPLPRATAITSTGNFTCASLAQGGVRCWGRNENGQLGRIEPGGSDQPLPVKGLTDVHSLSTGTGHACVRRSSGDVWCWGDGKNGQLGRGTRDASAPPAPVSGIDDAVTVVSGWSYSCALRATGEVWCWGTLPRSEPGEKGSDELTEDYLQPTRVPGIDGAVELISGLSHACARTRQDRVFCWGSNLWSRASHGPVELPGAGLVRNLAVGPKGLTCGITREGVPVCWQRRADAPPDSVIGPTPIEGVRNAHSILFAKNRLLIGFKDSKYGVWDVSSQLAKAETLRVCGARPGDLEACCRKSTCSESARRFLPPQTMLDGSYATAVSAGGKLVCMTARSGEVFCADTTERFPEPSWRQVVGVSGARSAIPGEVNTCAALEGGTVTCWGDRRSGVFGDRSAEVQTEPSEVPFDELFDDRSCQPNAPGTVQRSWPTDTIRSLSVSRKENCAVLHDGRVACWDRKSPAAIVPLAAPAFHVTTGAFFSCAVAEEGRVYCWSRGDAQVIEVAGIKDAVQVVAKNGRACALHSTGQVSCWSQGCNGFCPAQTVPRLCEVERLALEELPLEGDGERLHVMHRAGGLSTVHLDELARSYPHLPREPSRLEDVDGFRSVSASESFSCGVKPDGVVACWGVSYNDAIMDSVSHSSVPLPRIGLPPASEVAVARFRACALLESGQITCWGRGKQDPHAPRVESEIRGAHLLAVDDWHACAAVGRDVYCWRDDQDPLGHEKYSQQLVRVPLPN